MLATALADPSIATAGATGVYDTLGPASAALPYVTFQQQSSVRVKTFASAKAAAHGHIRKTVWLVKALAEDHYTAEVIDEACEAVLDNGSFAIADGFTLLNIERTADLSYPERDGPTTVYHVGGLYEVSVQ